MIHIKFDNSSNKVGISVKCKIDENSEKVFNLNRQMDEQIGATFQKLYSNYTKVIQQKTNKKQKKNAQSDPNTSQPSGVPTEPLDPIDVPISLYDSEEKVISLETTNKDAWKENYIFKINEQKFTVSVDLPSIRKIQLSKMLIAGMPSIVKIESENEGIIDELNKNSVFSWFVSKDTFNAEPETEKPQKKRSFSTENTEWELIEQGEGKKMCLLKNDYEKKLIKVECIPCDGKRQGLAVALISNDLVLAQLEIDKYPMTDRHKHTQSRLDSKNLRVMSYNILANCYAETSLAREQLFPYCPPEYVDFKYRRVLLVHEIKNYNSDIIFLQECEKDFLEEDLKSSLPEYTLMFKTKGDKTREGEATLFRSDRFKLIQSHDISLSEQLQNNSIFKNLWENISKKEELKKYVGERTTILQVTQVESIDNPGHIFLLANTHLFFHPQADFLRLLQVIVSAKYLEKLKEDLSTKENVKKVSILFGGDFNSDPPSHAFTYLFTQYIPFNSLTNDEKDLLSNCDDQLAHSLNLSAYTDFPFTNCIATFEAILDYVFFENDSLELKKVIELPPVERIKENVALPSQYIPSDHLPIIFEFSIKS